MPWIQTHRGSASHRLRGDKDRAGLNRAAQLEHPLLSCKRCSGTAGILLKDGAELLQGCSLLMKPKPFLKQQCPGLYTKPLVGLLLFLSDSRFNGCLFCLCIKILMERERFSTQSWCYKNLKNDLLIMLLCMRCTVYASTYNKISY